MKVDTIVLLDSAGKLDLTNHEINLDKDPQAPHTIRWWLFGELANGTFLPVLGPWPGFRWKDPVPAGTFVINALEHNGRMLSITDAYDNTVKKGKFRYELNIFCNGQFYTSEFGLRCMQNADDCPERTRGDHPVIINR